MTMSLSVGPHNRCCVYADGADSRPLWDYEYRLPLRQPDLRVCMYVCGCLNFIPTYCWRKSQVYVRGTRAGASGLDCTVRAVAAAAIA